MGTKIDLITVPVTVATSAVAGSSAANPALVSQARIIGVIPAGLATSTGWGLIESVVKNANGSITVTTRSAVGTADLTVDVIVAKVING